jgi:hypothetical protein
LVQHAALGAAPKHAPLAHADVDDAYQHPIESCPHVASVVAFSQASPAALHVALTAQVHVAGPAAPPPVHVWFVPHAVGVPQAPLVPHTCGPLGEHVVEPGVHWPWQTPTHAPQTPAPPQYGSAVGHATAVPHAPLAHVSTLLPEHRIAPAAQTEASIPDSVIASIELPVSPVLPVSPRWLSPWVASVAPPSPPLPLPLLLPALASTPEPTLGNSPRSVVQETTETTEASATTTDGRAMPS